MAKERIGGEVEDYVVQLVTGTPPTAADLTLAVNEDTMLNGTLDAALRGVYLEANRYAARFCRRLEDRFLRRREARVVEMLGELRRFYRLGDAGKLRAIEVA